MEAGEEAAPVGAVERAVAAQGAVPVVEVQEETMMEALAIAAVLGAILALATTITIPIAMKVLETIRNRR